MCLGVGLNIRNLLIEERELRASWGQPREETTDACWK